MRATLRDKGAMVLQDSSTFRGSMLDKLDPDDESTSVIRYHCDEEYLGIFFEAAQLRSSQAIGDAVGKATYLLRKHLVVQEAAERASCEIGFALANHLRVECPDSVQMTAVGQLQKRDDFDADVEEPPSEALVVSTVDMQEPPSEALMVGAVDVSTFSADRVERQKQAEAAGIGLRWFEALKWLCWLAAGIAVVNAGIVGMSLGSAAYKTSVFLYFVRVLVMFAFAALCWRYIVSWNRLSHFSSSGPKTYLWTRGADCIAYFVAQATYISTLSTATPTYDYQIVMTTTLGACVALEWCASYLYLKKRKNLFSL